VRKGKDKAPVVLDLFLDVLEALDRKAFENLLGSHRGESSALHPVARVGVERVGHELVQVCLGHPWPNDAAQVCADQGSLVVPQP
jgi:hypothetical protein